MKGRHRGAANGCESDDAESIRAPAKVVKPVLCSRVEEGNLLIRLRIGGHCLLALVIVAQRATEPQVRFLCESAPGERDEMFKLQSSHDETLRAEAVAAAVARGFAHPPGEVHGNVSAD